MILMAAVRGKAQTLYLVWTVAVFVLVVRYFYAIYSYLPDSGDYKLAVYAVLAGLASALGAGTKPAPER